MDQKMFQQILRRYFQGDASEEEIRIVDAWYDAMGKSDPSLLTASEKDALEQRYWSVISGHLRKTKSTNRATTSPPRPRAKGVVWYSLGVAASLTFIIISYLFLQKDAKPSLNETATVQPYASVKWTQLENAGGVVKQFDLPDGSRISLEPHSKLKYEPSFNQANREVFLEGEAHFEVAHDEHRPFLVHAREITTTVLGTSFRVKAFEDDKDIRVIVQTGKVSVQADQAGKDGKHKKEEIILTPNFQIVYNRNEGTMLRSIVGDAKPIPAEEKTRRMRFDEAPVAEIFQALEKVYGVDISFDKNRFAACVLTTSISDGGLYNRLDIICKAIGAAYTVEEDRILITGSGCD